MELPIPISLRVGATGPTVTLLHLALLRVTYEVDPAEVVSATFGAVTRQCVVKFQSHHRLPATGIVDDATAVRLLERSAGPHDKIKFFVFGQVANPNGSPAAGLTVHISDRDLRKEEKLGDTTVDKAGYYCCQYLATQFLRAEKGSADLVVRVLKGKDVLYEPTMDTIAFNAPDLAIISIALTKGNDHVDDEFTNIVHTVRPLLEGQNVSFADLSQDQTFQDITFLVNESGLNQTKLTQVVVAFKLETAYKIEAAFFYAIFVEQTLANSSKTDPTGMRTTIGLQTDLQLLFYDIVLLSPDIVKSAVQSAINDKFVPSSLMDSLSKIQRQLAEWQKEAEAYVANHPVEDQVFNQIENFLTGGNIDAINAIIGTNSYGNLTSVLNNLETAISSAATSAQTSSSSRPTVQASLNPNSLAAKVASVKGVKDERELAKFSEKDWEDALTHPELPTSEGTAESRQKHAKTLFALMENKYPTTAFAAQLGRTEHPVLATPAGHGMLKILQDNPDFDLAHGGVDILLKDAWEKEPSNTSSDTHVATAKMMKSVQRVFKLAPTFRQSTALLENGLESSTAIRNLGKQRFLTQYASQPDHPFTAKEGLDVFRRAEDVHLAATILAGNFQSSAAARRIPAFSKGIASAKLEAVTKDFPNMASLFLGGDACECADCMTVFSASAYLCDTMQFLANRWVIDTTVTGTPASGQGARTVLFNRRPDLGDTDLSCDNTNTALPYIDLICELLEDQVALPPPITVTGMTLTPGIISPALITTLKSQGYVFSDSATVSQPDKSTSSVIVRDPTIVVKLTPKTKGSTTDWNGRVLRQTYKTANQLAAAPDYVNDAAYTVLASKSYAFNLPFDLYHQETVAYFAQFGVRRSRLMRALQTAAGPTDVNIACEELSITIEEENLITTANPTGQETYWNTGTSDPVGTMAHVDLFITKTGLAYPDLQTMLSLGLNGSRSWLDPGNDMFIRHLDTSCNLAEKRIANLDGNGLDRFHRFIRLLKKVTPLGWDISSLDQAIVADKLGHNNIDDNCLLKIAQLQQVFSRIGSDITLNQCVGLYDVLFLYGAIYAQIFLNQSANGQINQDFTPANVAQNVLNEENNPGTGKKIGAYADYLSICLGRSGSDIAILLQSLPLQGNDILSPDSISTVYERHLFALKVNLSISDLMILKGLTTIDELSDPAQTLVFLDALDEVHSSGLTVEELQFYLLFKADDLDARTLPDQAIQSLLQTLQNGYIQAKINNASPYSVHASLAANLSATTLLMAKIPGFKTSDTTSLVAIITNKWTDPFTTPQAFISSKFSQLTDPATFTNIQNAQTALAGATDSNLQDLQFAFMDVLDQAVSAYFAQLDIQAFLVSTVVQSFNTTDDLINVILPLSIVAAAQNRSLLDILTDNVIIPNPVSSPPPAIDPTAFDAQFRALRLGYTMLAFIGGLNLAKADVLWLLTNKPSKWMALDAVRYQVDVASVSFDSWKMLWDAVQFAKKFPPVANPSDKLTPFSIYGFFQLALTSGATPNAVLTYLSKVTGWDLAMLTDLTTRFGFAVSDFVTPQPLTRLVAPLSYLRILHLPDFATAVALIKPTLLPSDAASMRSALKSLYDDSAWLGVLKNIMDPLRLMKRDALVTYLLAISPTMQGPDDLYDYFLIDVEMGSAMSTSRIVQAHATIQLFVQRCLMGIEPTCVADQTKDDGWAQWSWMANFQVWVANRKIFLWPENWIQPTLRDDKSEIFSNLESTLQQNQLTTQAGEDCTIAYLEALNEIGQLDVLCTYYQTSTLTSHVIARTKGGDPLVYYYRQFIQEREWTPWQKMDIGITGDTIAAFDRNNRLTVAWLEMRLDVDQSQTPTIPNGNSIPSGGESTDRPRQRWIIQLAVSERTLSGTWTPKKVSKDPLYLPPSGVYTNSDFLPRSEEIHILTWNLGQTEGQTITVTASIDRIFEDNDIPLPTIMQEAMDLIGDDQLYVGSFSLTGCKGYPEPNNDVTATTLFLILPAFRNSRMLPQVFTKTSTTSISIITPKLVSTREIPAVMNPSIIQSALSTSSDYAMKSIFYTTDFEPILNLTYGIFKTTYPLQISIVDWLAILLRLYLERSARFTAEAFAIERQIVTRTLVFGTFLPFFYSDVTRSFVIVPEKVGGKPAVSKTFSDVYTFIQLGLSLLTTYLKVWDETHDFKALKEQLLADDNYKTFVQELVFYITSRRELKFQSFYHPLMCYLLNIVYQNGVPALMAKSTQLYDTGFVFKTIYDPTTIVDSVNYPEENLDFALSGAYSSYNWEMFFHIPFEIGTLLNQDQQFQAAQSWFNYIFNPIGAASGGDTPNKYWNTKPFFQTSMSDYLDQLIDHIMYKISRDPTAKNIPDLQFAVSQWRAKPFSPYVIARSRTVAFQIATVLAYVKNLIDWGDSLFRQFTREAITSATQLYILADKLLGPKPLQVPPALPTPIQTFNEVEKNMDIFGNALVDMENLVPDLGLPHQGQEITPPGASELTFSTLYFGIPQNENMLQYWDTVADRLFKIRNSMNIDGVAASLALFSPPIDPGALVRAYAAGIDVNTFLSGLSAPVPFYRFFFMMQKANELIGVTAGLGSSLLSALEKRDAEALARLRSDQELLVLNAVRNTKVRGIDEAKQSLQALITSRAVAQERLTFYSSQAYMNAWEIAATVLSGTSLILDIAVTLTFLLSGGLKLIPNFKVGCAGFGGSPTVTIETGGQSAGGSSESIGTSLANASRALDKAASMANQQGAFRRRQDEWDFNAALATKELATIDAQIQTAIIHVDVLQKDLTAHDASITSSIAVGNFLKSKYTNTELYDWMVSQIKSVYFTAYNLALDAAKRAERTYTFELGDDSLFIGSGYWVSLKNGLLAAETLQTDLKRMEAAYLQRNAREYEITKNVSLLELDPLALITFKTTGKCLIQIPEEAFDMDHPGHYFRRNKSVSISIPCVAGPQVSVSARLSLVSNRYRNKPGPAPTVTSPNGPYPEQPPGADPRFTYNVGTIQSIATSSAINDSGTFEVNFRDERYLPFENTGAIAYWQLELPTVIRRFDYNTITDVIFHIQYTARDGGSGLQSMVEAKQIKLLNEMTLDAKNSGLYQAYSIKQQFSTEWVQLLKTNTTSVNIDARFLPYFTQGHTPSITGVLWLAQVAGNPTTFSFSLDGQSVSLNQEPDYGNSWAGYSAPNAVVLGKPFTLSLDAASAAALQDMVAVVQYTLK